MGVRRWRKKKTPRLPDPMLCTIFIQTPLGVTIHHVMADFLRRPFHKHTYGQFWTSWRPLEPAELRRLLLDDNESPNAA